MNEPRTLVCSACKCASCWMGQFYCDDYVSAGLVRATEAQLRELNVEDPSYFMGPLKARHDNPAVMLLEDLNHD